MAGQICKGKIATISDTKARVVPSDREDKATAKLVVPWHLRGDSGALEVGDEVVYAEFDDGTGILLGRMDGNCGIEPGSGNTGNPE